MSVEPKLWGWTETLSTHELHTAHRVDIRAGGYSSRHKHEGKWNGFHCIRGTLLVEVFVKGHQQVEHHLLQPGDSFQVNAGLVHRMSAPSGPVTAIETYWPTARSGWVDPDDIVRLDEGGIKCPG